MNKVIRSFEVSAEIDAAIKRLAKGAARTPSQIVSDAVEQLLAEQNDLSVELERWAEYERTGEAIDLADAAKTLKAKLEARLKAPARRRRTPSK